MYQALYRKYRPKNLKEIFGQDIIVKIITNSVENKKINHAYLFAGPRGTGKTSIAKIFAKMVNCENLKNNTPCGECVSCTQTANTDIIEIDAASNNGVDEIRELRNKVNLASSYGKYKIYIIDEVHMLTTGAFNALLKTLEEPPEHVIFILATTDPHKIPETILSRCQRLDFKKIDENSIVKRLEQIAQTEKIKIEKEALYEIARLSDGGMRDSIGMLDQAQSYTSEKITIQDINEINGTLTTKDMQKIIEMILKKQLPELLEKLDFYNTTGKNFIKLTENLINFIRNIILCKEAPKYFKTISNNFETYSKISETVKTDQLLDYINQLNESLFQMKQTNNSKLILEITLIKIIGEISPTPKQEELPSPKIIKTTKQKNLTLTIDTKELSKLKEIRINNTLSAFNKKKVRDIEKQLPRLQELLLNKEISQQVSLLLDGTLKAASQTNLIFVYEQERVANKFNENLITLEKIIKKVLNQQYKIIATDIKQWEKIKNEFNNKKKKYEYIEEKYALEEIAKKTKEFNEFEELIEYN